MTKLSLQKMQTEVAIVGGGMVGMTLALALARIGIKVIVVDRDTPQEKTQSERDGRVSAVAYGSMRILDAIGVWQHVKEEAEAITDIRVSDGATPFFLHYHYEEVGEAPFGWIVENRLLNQAFAAASNDISFLTHLAPVRIAKIERDAKGVMLTLEDGRQISAALLVGADGKNSFVRKHASIESIETVYDQTAIVCTIQHEKPHEGLAQERFLPNGPFAVLPMTNNRSSLVWVEPKNHADYYLTLPEDKFVEEIKFRVGEYLGEISLEGKRWSYPLSLQHAKTYIDTCLALIGDAAHAIHPLAGQGVNLGFRDAAVLSELIEDAKRVGIDIGSLTVLEHYQRWRRPDNLLMMAMTDGLNRLFSNRNAALKNARGLGFWMVEKLPPLKKFFMRSAMGMAGDLPRLMRKAS